MMVGEARGCSAPPTHYYTASSDAKIVLGMCTYIGLVYVCIVERVVGTSKFQITKPDALFVVFLGIKWAYDFLKKNRS